MTSESEGPSGNAPDISVGVSDTVLLVVSGAGFLLLAATIYSIVLTRLKSAKEIEEEEKEANYDEKLAAADISTLNRAQRRARAKLLMKKQRRVAPNTVPGQDGELNEENQATHGSDSRHLSRKDRQKAAKAAEQKERKLFEEERRQQQLEAQKIAQQEKRERERLQNEKAEEGRQARTEQRLSEEKAAYESWKKFLATPDGTIVLTVKEWIEELSKSRIVYFKTLAKRFDTTSETVGKRIDELLVDCRITGIPEGDRFIYISRDEMSTISSFLLSRDKTSVQKVIEELDEIIKN
jgi:hypothetical protein